ncbi:glucosyltransferase [Spirochaetia bacterium]|nr:glucosyltransferase [Spirochaetia bacterium]
MTIPIVFSSDDRFVPYMAATMQSVMEHSSRDKKYIFYVLYKAISESNIELLQEQIAKFPQFSIKFIDVMQYLNQRQFYTTNTFPIEAYFRLFIPWLFPDYQKIIWLDGDMISCSDIAELYEIDLCTAMLAAARDIYAIDSYYRGFKIMKDYLLSLDLRNMDNYFSTGVLVFNTEQFRKNITLDKLLDLAALREWRYVDQDVLNTLCNGKTVFLLPQEWNFIYSIADVCTKAPVNIAKAYSDAKDNPKIVHFAGLKPWKVNTNMYYFHLFWKYAARTPFIDTIIARMNEGGFIRPSMEMREYIYSDILRGRIGLRFILKCLITYTACIFRRK